MKHQANRAFFNDQKEKITIYLKHNIPDFNTVTFTNEEFNPIGTSIDGYINNDKNLSFTAGKDVKIFSYSEELDKMFKEPRKAYDEILSGLKSYED
ncbi:DUF1433 domain-containing protein [Listeria monocytogenes]|nr:DUF1433 domain-containing protein [Listeria monocytogenes]EFQ5019296.1 DUF1433 domain-containing protein [Listeria monocytogenes]